MNEQIFLDLGPSANDSIYQNEEILKKEAEQGRYTTKKILEIQPRIERSRHKLTFI